MDRGELATFLETGPAMLGATADEGLRPEAFRVWGATLDDNGRLRILASADAGRTLAVLRKGARICLLVTDITTFRSLQAKGHAAGGAVAPGPADAELLRRYHDRFVSKLAEVGHPARLGDHLRPAAVFVVTVEVDDLYDQTPGPRAGARVGGRL